MLSFMAEQQHTVYILEFEVHLANISHMANIYDKLHTQCWVHGIPTAKTCCNYTQKLKV